MAYSLNRTKSTREIAMTQAQAYRLAVVRAYAAALAAIQKARQ